MKKIKPLFVILSLNCLMGCVNNIIEVPNSPYTVSKDSFSVETIAEGFTIPYGLAIVSDNDYFISDRIGKFFQYKDGAITEISGMPKVISYGNPYYMHKTSIAMLERFTG